MSLFVRSVSFISIFVSVSYICSYGFYFQFILFLSSTNVYNRDWSLVQRCNRIFFHISFCAKSVMITNGATAITSQPSRIYGREQLPFSAAGASGAVRLVTSCCVARPLDGGQLRTNNSLSRQVRNNCVHTYYIWWSFMYSRLPAYGQHTPSSNYTAYYSKLII